MQPEGGSHLREPDHRRHHVVESEESSAMKIDSGETKVNR